MGALRTSDARPGLTTLAPAAPVRVESPSTTLRSTRMTLRALTPDDREAFIDLVRGSRDELDKHAPLHQEGETDDALFERQLWLTLEGERTGRAFRRVGQLDDGRLAGAFNLPLIARGLETRADCNWWIASDLSGRGLATEGVRCLLEHATADLPGGLGIHVVEAGIKRENVASVRVAEKVGFARKGDERSHLRTGDDWAMHDIYAYRVGATGGG